MPTVVTMEEMIQEVLDKADAVEAEGKKLWPNEADMIRMCEDDAAEMRSGADYMKQGLFVDAARTFSLMDTAARERVPDNAWDYCQQKSEAHYRKLREEKERKQKEELAKVPNYCI